MTPQLAEASPRLLPFSQISCVSMSVCLSVFLQISPSSNVMGKWGPIFSSVIPFIFDLN